MELSLGRIGCLVMAGVLLLSPAGVMAQDVMTDQVSITFSRGQIFGLTSGEGVARQFLASGEDVVVVEARGVTGYVQTTRRLLGFSGRMQRWMELPLSGAEQIVRWVVTPRLIIAIGKQQGYVFQGELGRWKKEAWGAGEMVADMEVRSHVGVVTTNRRALGFSALTGGFFPLDLPRPVPKENISMNDHIVIVDVAARKFVFRSGLALWTELP